MRVKRTTNIEHPQRNVIFENFIYPFRKRFLQFKFEKGCDMVMHISLFTYLQKQQKSKVKKFPPAHQQNSKLHLRIPVINLSPNF